MTSPVLALRAAILARCSPDTMLAALLGGTGRFYDEPPRGEPPPYVAFGPVEVADWSTSSDRGHEQDVSLAVWARPGTAASAIAAAERLAALLDGAGLELDGHRLVQLAVTAQELDRDPDAGLGRAILRLRATTEVAG